ncbi:MAG TPA: hypothetical protein VM869_25005, partial [Enhygromyxa sp.]|nr:hypothetical protein [Enhygromyxa sp.]
EFEPVFREYLEQHKPTSHLLVRKRDKILYATHFEVVSGSEPAEQLSKAAWRAFSFNPNSAATRPARSAGGPAGRSDLDLRFK